MSKGHENQPDVPATPDNEPKAQELREDELEHVSGGIGGLLVPAVQKVREAAHQSRDQGGAPIEDVSFAYTKVP